MRFAFPSNGVMLLHLPVCMCQVLIKLFTHTHVLTQTLMHINRVMLACQVQHTVSIIAFNNKQQLQQVAKATREHSETTFRQHSLNIQRTLWTPPPGIAAKVLQQLHCAEQINCQTHMRAHMPMDTHWHTHTQTQLCQLAKSVTQSSSTHCTHSRIHTYTMQLASIWSRPQ